MVLPSDDDRTGLLETDRWRIIFVYFPIGVNFVTILALIFVLPEDSLKYLLKTSNYKDARQLIRKIYKDCNTEL